MAEEEERVNVSFRDKRLLSIIWEYLRPQKRLFYTISAILVFSVLIGIASPLLFQDVLSQVEQKTEDKNRVIVGISLYLTVGIIAWVVQLGLFLLITRLNARFIRDIRSKAYAKVLKNKLSFFDKQKSGNLTSRLIYDTRELSNIAMHLSWFVISLFQVSVSIIILFAFSFRIAIWVVGAMPIIIVLSIFFARLERRATKKWREKFSDVNHKFSEIMAKIAISKTFNREEENLRYFKEINEATFKASVIRGLAIFIFWPITDLFKHAFTFIVLYVGAQEVQAGLPIATFIMFLVLINYFYWPLISLAENYKSIQDVLASFERLARIAHDPTLVEEDNGTHDASLIKGKLEFRDVSFAYDEENYVLKNLNFIVQPGQRIALVGHTGAGKSTIGSLLMRYYPITKGQILIDDIPIEEYTLGSYRESLSMVSQRVLLFKGTIRENLKVSDSELTDEQIWDALEQVQAKEFIDRLPEKLDTIVEEEGKNLSQGEKQMISFARALLSNPKIVIFDEATSAVDLYTESKILDAIDVVLKGRTAISIAHRLTTILNSDLIVVLEDGEIKEMGTHTELLEHGKIYAEMYNLYLETQSAKYLNKIISKIEHP
ncbi:MAG: ABC transporter ATP-binding protein [Candidatus Heimdallarchaeota archaeon]|nr:ABC transporter ATP-binding protein [Candidatus Heimdallarchaeota archaeon]